MVGDAVVENAALAAIAVVAVIAIITVNDHKSELSAHMFGTAPPGCRYRLRALTEPERIRRQRFGPHRVPAAAELSCALGYPRNSASA
ncbi:hypothetical protein [Nocardia sp. NPDC051463]|uniref:hypothetical protein n=1 Tax=Nocardia sp. NPDC051463 TaxID=3154845 RepID=UPI00344DCC16